MPDYPDTLTLTMPWGDSRFRMSFIELPGPDGLVVLGQTTLQDVLCVDVMSVLRQTVLKLRRVSGGYDTGVSAESGADD